MFEFQPFLKRLKKTAFVVRVFGGEGEGWIQVDTGDTGPNIGG